MRRRALSARWELVKSGRTFLVCPTYIMKQIKTIQIVSRCVLIVTCLTNAVQAQAGIDTLRPAAIQEAQQGMSELENTLEEGNRAKTSSGGQQAMQKNIANLSYAALKIPSPSNYIENPRTKTMHIIETICEPAMESGKDTVLTDDDIDWDAINAIMRQRGLRVYASKERPKVHAIDVRGKAGQGLFGFPVSPESERFKDSIPILSYEEELSNGQEDQQRQRHIFITKRFYDDYLRIIYISPSSSQSSLRNIRFAELIDHEYFEHSPELRGVPKQERHHHAAKRARNFVPHREILSAWHKWVIDRLAISPSGSAYLRDILLAENREPTDDKAQREYETKFREYVKIALVRSNFSHLVQRKGHHIYRAYRHGDMKSFNVLCKDAKIDSTQLLTVLDAASREHIQKHLEDFSPNITITATGETEVDIDSRKSVVRKKPKGDTQRKKETLEGYRSMQDRLGGLVAEYIIMEDSNIYQEATTPLTEYLLALVDRDDITFDQKAQLSRDILKKCLNIALQAARRGVVIKDNKPVNFGVRDDGEVVLFDVGPHAISKSAGKVDWNLGLFHLINFSLQRDMNMLLTLGESELDEETGIRHQFRNQQLLNELQQEWGSIWAELVAGKHKSQEDLQDALTKEGALEFTDRLRTAMPQMLADQESTQRRVAFIPTEIAYSLLQLIMERVESATMSAHKGNGTTPETTVYNAEAVIFSPYEAYEIIRRIEPENIPEEELRLQHLIAAVSSRFMETASSESLPISRMRVNKLLEECFSEVSDYYANFKKGEQENIVHDCVYRFSLSLDERLKHATEENEKTAIKMLKDGLEEESKHTRVLVASEDKMERRRKARVEWESFIKVHEETLRDSLAHEHEYEKTFKQQQARIRQLERTRKTIEPTNRGRLARVVRAIENAKQAAQNMDDLVKLYRSHIQYLGEMERHITGLEPYHDVEARINKDPDLDEEAKKAKLKVESLKRVKLALKEIAQKNKRIDDIVYEKYQEAKELSEMMKKSYQEKQVRLAALKASGSEEEILMLEGTIETAQKNTRAFAEAARFIKDFLAHLHRAESYYLRVSDSTKHAISNDNKKVVVFAQQELNLEYVLHLIDQFGDSLGGIVCTEGTTLSHWVIIAAQKQVPVVILQDLGIALKERKESLESVVGVGTPVILSTSDAEGKSSVTVAPDTLTREKYLRQAREQKLYHEYCLQVHGPDRYVRRADGIQVGVGGNTATMGDVGAVVAQHGAQVVLTRSEVPLSAHADSLITLIRDMSPDSGASALKVEDDKKVFFEQYRDDLVRLFMAFKDAAGPFALRLFDIEPDKVREIMEALPEGMRVGGFDFFTTPIGREVVTLQIAAIVDAYHIAKEQGCLFELSMTVPMAKSGNDISSFIRQEIAPKVVERLKIGGTAPAESAMEEAVFGLMIELLKAAEENIVEIVKNSDVKDLKYGTNDLTADILNNELFLETTGGDIAEIENFEKVTRDDVEFSEFFFELHPKVVSLLGRGASLAALWNSTHAPDEHKTPSICGEVASRKKGALMAFYFAMTHSIPIDIGVPPFSIPTTKNFIKFIEPDDVRFFDIIDESMEQKDIEAELEKVIERVDARIKADPGYKRNVLDKLSSESANTLVEAQSTPKGSSAGTGDVFKKNKLLNISINIAIAASA